MTNDAFKATGYVALAVLALFAFVGIVAAWDESHDSRVAREGAQRFRDKGAL